MYSQSYGFSSSHVWMWELDHKEAECQKIVAFKLLCWRRHKKVPWTARRSNQSVLNPEYSLEGLMLKLKLQYFGHLMWRADSLEKTLMLGKIEGKRRRGWQRMSWLDSITDSTDMNLSKLWEIVEDRGAWHTTLHGVTKSRTQLSNWQQQQLHFNGFSSVQSLSRVSLRPHELQHARPPYPSPTPRTYPNSCPLSQWCQRWMASHPLLSPSPPAFSLSQHQGIFQWVSSLH